MYFALAREVPERRDDASFDRLYPEAIRWLAPRFWTPVKVATCAAQMFSKAGARTVLDVGSGVGKFALVAGRAAPELRIVGVEQRPDLVALARLTAQRLRVHNVDFRTGDVTRIPWNSFDGLYFFNPFAENLFEVGARFDDQVELNRHKFLADVLRVEMALRSARVGTMIVTYHGMGGRIPASYDLHDEVRAHTDWLRLWIKRSARDDGAFQVEIDDRVVHVPARSTSPTGLTGG